MMEEKAPRVGDTNGGAARSHATTIKKQHDGQSSPRVEPLQRTGNRSEHCRERHRRTATKFYHELIAAIERARVLLGMSMQEFDDLCGTNDGHWSHCCTPDTPTGRIAVWATLQLALDALARRNVCIAVRAELSGEPSEPSTLLALSKKPSRVLHWRDRDRLRALGKRGGLRTAANHDAEWLRRRARKGGFARSKKLRESAP